MTCQTCTANDRKGYCAPLRCYCGHPTCWAFASYAEPVALQVVAKPSQSRAAASWANREESTWIDQM